MGNGSMGGEEEGGGKDSVPPHFLAPSAAYGMK